MKNLIKTLKLTALIAIIFSCGTVIAQNGKDFKENRPKKTEKYKKMNRHTSTLPKADTNDITEKYWKLIELNGNPVIPDETFKHEPYLILKKEDRRVKGFGGCNNFNGSYNLEGGNKIQFSQMISTKMFCLNNMEIEQQLHRAFEDADNYTLSEDGQYLSLNKGGMAPLARFEVVYLR